MNLIKMLIVPVIFFSVTSGIAAIGDVQKLKRVGGKVVLVYVAMTVLACQVNKKLKRCLQSWKQHLRIKYMLKLQRLRIQSAVL